MDENGADTPEQPLNLHQRTAARSDVPLMEEAGEAEVELLRDRRSAPNIGFKQFRKRSRKRGRSPSWDAHGIDPAHRAAASIMLASLTR
jgi:hypothetical protein